MKKLLEAVFYILAPLHLSLCLFAQQPGLIDLGSFFADTNISGAAISPDGRAIAFLQMRNGVPNIFVKRIGDSLDHSCPVTDEHTRPVDKFFWTMDSRYVIYVKDHDGDENYNVSAIEVTLEHMGQWHCVAKSSTRSLTAFRGVNTQILDLPRNRPDCVLIGVNQRDRRWKDVFELSLSTGSLKLIFENTSRINGWLFDDDGKISLVQRVTPSGDTQFFRVDGTAMRLVYSCNVFETCRIVDFASHPNHIYFLTNRRPRDLLELMDLNILNSLPSRIDVDPAHRVDVDSAVVSSIDHRVLLVNYDDDKERHHFLDRGFERQYKRLESQLRGLIIDLGSVSLDETCWVVTAYSDTDPGAVYVWNRKADTLQKQYALHPKLPRTEMSSRQPIHYRSSDGLRISAYLTLPRGLQSKHLPLVVLPHGGPWRRDYYIFDVDAQFLANRGYAVLQPNFRGSVGYGKKFVNAGNGEWGRKMQDDLTWGVRALVRRGIIDPKRIAIVGSSYGGYAALAGVTFTPTLYSAAVACAAPSDLVSLLESIPTHWEAERRLMYLKLGDPHTEAGRQLLISESPIHAVKNIIAPLLLVQGRNDPRVSYQESDEMVSSIRQNNRFVEYMISPKEGHEFSQPLDILALKTETETFLARYLGGRCQINARQDVKERIEALVRLGDSVATNEQCTEIQPPTTP